jgi:hypothetical protein
MRFSKKIATLLSLATLSISISSPNKVSAADYTSPYLPELKSLTINSVDESQNWFTGPGMSATVVVRVHRNAVRGVILSFGNSSASNPLAPPCRQNISFASSSPTIISSVIDGDWRIETLNLEMVIGRTACAGRFDLMQIDIFDVTDRQLQIGPVYQTSMFWNALGEASPYLPCEPSWVGAPAWSRTKCN